MELLTEKAEQLLVEVLDHRNDNGQCDIAYWENRFEGLNTADDALLRSLFKELKESNMISIMWADNTIYFLSVLSRGLEYDKEKERMNPLKQGDTYTNNFFGDSNNITVQQNATNIHFEGSTLNKNAIDVLIQTIRKYDSVIEGEYGIENAGEIRRTVDELEESINSTDDDKRSRKLLEYIRDLSVNAGGGLVATGIMELIEKII